MTQEKGVVVKIGELLEKAGVVSENELGKRLEISNVIGQPIGQTMVQLGSLSEQQLLAVVEVQSLLLDGALSLDVAGKTVRLLCDDELSLEEALRKVGFTSRFAEGSRLGKLLIAAGLVADEDLWSALGQCLRTCSPLGHSILQLGILTPAAVADALAVQRRIRAGEITAEEGIRQLESHHVNHEEADSDSATTLLPRKD